MFVDIRHTGASNTGFAISKLIVDVTVTNMRTNVSINIKALVDGGCEVAYLVLVEEDRVSLGLQRTGSKGGTQGDGSAITVNMYEPVIVSFAMSDGSELTTSHIYPGILNDNRPEAVDTSVGGNKRRRADSKVFIDAIARHDRVIGYGLLHLLQLKQDFANHRLHKVSFRL